MKAIKAEIASLGLETYAVTYEYTFSAKSNLVHKAIVIADLEEKTATIVKHDGIPSGFKPEYITNNVSHIINVWKMDAEMLDVLFAFPIVIK